MTMHKAVSKAAELVGSYGAHRLTPDQMDATTVAIGHVNHINRDLELFILFCYQQSEAGRFIHLNGLQIPKGVFTPWGGSGKSKLTRTQRDRTRLYMFSLRTSKPRPLFFYMGRHWHVDTVQYPAVDQALAWLDHYKLTPNIWLDMQC